jgi:hypothetical protein
MTSSTTGSIAKGRRRAARPVTPPPQGLSRGNVALSTSNTRTPALASRWAAVEPAGPAPTTATSNVLTNAKLQWRVFPGVCPSGQRERAVNPSAQPTEVRILPPPLHDVGLMCDANAMKGQQKPKQLAKKAPQKTLKEQRAAKKAKKKDY